MVSENVKGSTFHKMSELVNSQIGGELTGEEGYRGPLAMKLLLQHSTNNNIGGINGD